MTSSDRYCTQLSYHTTDHEHDECFPLHPPQLAIEKYTYKDARAENFEVLIIFDTIHVEDARNHVHHRRRDTARTATNDTSLESAQKVKKYTREPALSARSSRRETRAKMKIHVFCYSIRTHRYCFPYFRVFRPRKSCFWKISFCYSP